MFVVASFCKHLPNNDRFTTICHRELDAIRIYFSYYSDQETIIKLDIQTKFCIHCRFPEISG